MGIYSLIRGWRCLWLVCRKRRYSGWRYICGGVYCIHHAKKSWRVMASHQAGVVIETCYSQTVNTRKHNHEPPRLAQPEAEPISKHPTPLAESSPFKLTLKSNHKGGKPARIQPLQITSHPRFYTSFQVIPLEFTLILPPGPCLSTPEPEPARLC